VLRTRTDSSNQAAWVSCSRLNGSTYPNCCGAVNQRLKSLSSGKSARYVLWEPGAGGRLWRPGGRRVTGVPTAEPLARKQLGYRGYSSWAAYCKREFHMSQGRAYQLLRAARVVDECTTVHSLQVISESEAVARVVNELTIVSRPSQ
jgi:hypothetical protein